MRRTPWLCAATTATAAPHESPEKECEGAWKKGKVIMEKLAIDDEVWMVRAGVMSRGAKRHRRRLPEGFCNGPSIIELLNQYRLSGMPRFRRV
jgi:hypothetical protein